MNEPIISVEKLTKNFKSKVKEPGMKGALKALFNPKYKNVNAVNNISFNVAAGELVAFIGLNGAGKSTTLKMLSGILYQDSGNIRILGMNPKNDRQKLAYNIGTVFGQKPQLWFHLPAIDSFNLFAKIYELDDAEYKKRLDMLIKRFDITDFVNQPVRKLSLGQRMRCEIVLSLLHKPKIVFLDEPTIGLDIVAKRNIRELIKEINDKEGVTVLLTSHDIGDIEKICKKVIVINKGIIIYDGELKNLKKRYVTRKTIKVLSEDPIKIPKKPGLKIIKKGVYGAKIEINTKKVSIKSVMENLMENNDIIDINIEEPPIEEIIEEVYKK